MAYREIVKIGDPILRLKCKPVTNFNQGLWTLLDDMLESMYKFKGMGLAAPQVGVAKRVVIVEVNNMFIEFINPEILEQSGEQTDEEACLSVPKIRGKVTRPAKMTVKAQDRYGNYFVISGEKLLAVCMSHEIDHLDGVLFTDKMITEEK